MISSVVGVSGVLLALAGSALSQGTNANCSSKFDWAGNDRHQNICLITAYLRSACLADPTDAYVNALPGPTYYYVQPNIPDKCTCSMVYYNTIMACALCQGGETTPWSGYITNCTSDQVTNAPNGFPDNIPIGTDVPAWAYMDVRLSDNFNITQAQLIEQANGTFIEGQTPSSTSNSASSTSVFFSTPSSDQNTATLTSSPAESSTAAPVAASSSHKSNAGAIAGGVVGGVAGIALIAFALLFWQRRRTHAPAPTMATSDVDPTVVGSLSPPVSPGPGPMHTGSVHKLYNPDDPTTFPQAHPAPAMGYAYGRDSSVMTSHPGGYTGAAEL